MHTKVILYIFLRNYNDKLSILCAPKRGELAVCERATYDYKNVSVYTNISFQNGDET